jgi:hypothetical protein
MFTCLSKESLAKRFASQPAVGRQDALLNSYSEPSFDDKEALRAYIDSRIQAHIEEHEFRAIVWQAVAVVTGAVLYHAYLYLTQAR